MRYFSVFILLGVVLVGTSEGGYITDKTIEVVVDGSTVPYTDGGGTANDWYGRNMITIVDENRWVMALRSGVSHIDWAGGDSIHLMTSNDEGRTWSDLNQWFDGSPITGLPAYDGNCHSEPGLYKMPNGDLILQYWKDAHTNGTRQMRSTDDGKTWVTDIDQISVLGVPGAADNKAIGTQNLFIDPENPTDVYMAFEYYSSPETGSLLAKSTDNGHTYSFLSWMGSPTHPHSPFEPSIEYVGGRTIVAVMRGRGLDAADPFPATWMAVSTDMGASFSEPVDISDQIDGGIDGGLWQRARIYKESNPSFQYNTELDYAAGEGLLWGFGIHSTDGYTRKPVAYWSDDNGTTWNGPELLHGPMFPGTDTGYGDIKRRTDGTFVADTYYCQPGDYGVADVEQYTFKFAEGSPPPPPTVVIEHVGGTDPVTEGFTVALGTPGMSETVDGEEAWKLWWTSEQGSGRLWTSPGIFAANPQLDANGWIAEARIKFETVGTTNDVEVRAFGANDGATLNGLAVDSEGIKRPAEPPVYWALIDANVPSAGFHDYKIIYDPHTNPEAGGTYTYYLDGALIDTNSRDDARQGTGDEFGFGMGGDSGPAWYAWVRLSSIPAVRVPGDANYDGTVDDEDATILAANWHTPSGATWAMGDFNGDERVDEKDATLLAANWTVAASASAPEPSVPAMLVCLMLAITTLSRRSR